MPGIPPCRAFFAAWSRISFSVLFFLGAAGGAALVAFPFAGGANVAAAKQGSCMLKLAKAELQKGDLPLLMLMRTEEDLKEQDPLRGEACVVAVIGRREDAPI